MAAAAALLAALAAALFTSYPSHVSDPTFYSPHENVRWHLAQDWIRENRPTHRLPAFDRLPPDIAPALTPRDAAMEDGTVVPKDFPYSVATVAMLIAWVPDLATYLTAISGLGVVICVALLAYELTRRRDAALLAGSFVAVSTPFWSANAGLLETGGTTTTCFLAGLVALCRGRRGSSEGADGTAWIVAGGVLLGLAVGFHHAVALLVGAVIVCAALRRFGGSPRDALLLGAGAAGAVLPLLVFNTWLFGSPFATGYGVGASFYDATVENNSGGLAAVRPDLLAEQLWRYGGRLEVVLLVGAGVLGWAALRRGPASAFVRTLGLAFLLGGIPYLVFTGARPLWGAAEYHGNASFLRYALPLFAVASVFAAGWVTIPQRHYRWARLLLAVVVLLGAVVTTATLPGNPFDRRRSVVRMTAQRERLLSTIPPDALVVTAKSDKLLWPARSTLSAPFLAERQEDGAHLYELEPSPERLASVLGRLHERGEDVWLLDDGEWFSSEAAALPTLDLLLRQRGLGRQQTGTDGLHRIATVS